MRAKVKKNGIMVKQRPITKKLKKNKIFCFWFKPLVNKQSDRLRAFRLLIEAS